jgi:hypothetical protein
MAVLPTGIGPVTGYNIERSLRFNSADTAYLNRTLSAGSTTTWTWSGWVKRSSLGTAQTIFTGYTDSVNYAHIIFNTTDTLKYASRSGGSNVGDLETVAKYRDPSAWYHIVLSKSGTSVLLYVNGVSVSWTGTTPTASDAFINGNRSHFIGQIASAQYFNGYITEINFIGGSALDPNSFGQFNANTGVWEPKTYTGSYSGTNSFFLKFADNSNTTAATLGKDSSGNGNNWTPNLFSVTAGSGNDSLVDSPTSYGTDTGAGGEVRGNYCTLNPLDKGTNATLANGNLYGSTSTTAWAMIRSTFAISSGKWYWEFTVATTQIIIGLAKSNASLANYVGADANGWGWYGATGNKVNGGTQVTYVGVWAANDVIGVSFDADVGTLVFYKNGVSQGTAYTGLTSGPYFPAISFSSASDSANANFGQRGFQKWNGSAYVANTAPSGFKALCTQNLPTPTIGATSTTQANDYFNAITYTGNGSSQSVTGVGFQPDLVWIKNRATANSNRLIDAVRGATKELYSDLTGAEYTDAQSLTSFNSDGFSVGNFQGVNGSGNGLISWNWKANGAGSTNTAGTITSTVSANTTSGFSIVTYTGTGSNATVGHGLGVAPSMVIAKVRSSAGDDWTVYHTSIGATNRVMLNLTNASAASTVWNNTAPTSSVFSVGTIGDTNRLNATIVAYCFAPVAGYSAFGSYTGNGSTDGPFIYTGFRPRYLLVKNASDGTANATWIVIDSARSDYNQAILYLVPSTSGAEASSTGVATDFLSNGFKIRNTSTAMNANTNTIIYAAFAENPFKYSLAR